MVTNNKKENSKFFENGKSLSELLNEAIEAQGLDIKKLSELTDIPMHYLTALSESDFSKLPAIPYARGYLMRIAEVMRIDKNLLLRAYKQELSFKTLKSSGPEDKLPSNRFASKHSRYRKNLIIIGAILVLVVGYGLWRIDDFLGTPKIEIISPAADNFIVNDPSIKLLGIINAKDKLTINGEEVLTGENGKFEKDFSLQTGVNSVEFKIKRFLGKESIIIRQVIYQPQTNQ
jgi:hypothetical protein